MSLPSLFQAPTPLQYFQALVDGDEEIPLVEAAASIAQDEEPALDVQGVLAEIDRMADTLKRRIPADAVALQRLRWLNRYFFQELGFAGNVNDYYAPGNSHLHTVLATRRGIPITLAVIYIELAGQIGLTARGVSFPGHFLVKLRLHNGSGPCEVVIDPFTGNSLSRDELDDMVGPYKRSQGITGDFDAPLGLFLQAATSREVLARMLRNLKEIHRSADDLARLVAVLNRLVVLLPDAAHERRDRGLALSRLGHAEAAIDDLENYLAQAPDAADHDAIAGHVAALRSGGDPTFH